MTTSIVLALHITGGSLGILSGMASLFPKKGSRLHKKIGNVFFYSMILMTLTATYLAIFSKPSAINATIGLLTFYMVVTAQSTATNLKGKNRWIEYAGLFFILGIFIFLVIISLEVAKSEKGYLSDGIPAAAYYSYAVIALLALSLDIKVIIKGGVYGAQRVARHLWRMCFALFVACGSLFLGQPQVFPEPIRKLPLLATPVIISILVLFFWLIKVYVGRRFKRSRRKLAVQAQVQA